MVRVVKQPEQRRSEIVQAACRIFLQKGYESTTMADIMHQLDIAKGTIYHYFPSKEDLLDAVLESITNDKKLKIQALFASLRGNALERLQILIHAISYDITDREVIDKLHKPANAGMHLRLHAKTMLMLAPFFADLIDTGNTEGVFSTPCPLECAEFILAATTFLTDIGIYSWTSSQLERRIKAMPVLIERQLGAPSGSFDFLLGNLQKGLEELQSLENTP